jgi:hypothetical protein
MPVTAASRHYPMVFLLVGILAGAECPAAPAQSLPCAGASASWRPTKPPGRAFSRPRTAATANDLHEKFQANMGKVCVIPCHPEAISAGRRRKGGFRPPFPCGTTNELQTERQSS